MHHHTRSPEDVFRDFRARRAGIVKALTTGQLASRISSLLLFVLLVCGCFSDAIAASVVRADVEKFYVMCDPGEPACSPDPVGIPRVLVLEVRIQMSPHGFGACLLCSYGYLSPKIRSGGSG